MTPTERPEAEQVARELCPEYPLDIGVAAYVATLRAGGVETFESCQGGEGHAMPEPTVRFYGERAAGWAALAVAQANGLPVLSLYREWAVIDGEPSGPTWGMTFRFAAGSIEEPS